MVFREPDRKDGQRTNTMIIAFVLGIVWGTVAAFVGRWTVEGLAGTYDVRAVISEWNSTTTEGQHGPRTGYEVLAIAEDGRAIELPTRDAFGLADPVVARLSSVTDRVLSVRGAADVVEAHHPWEKITAMSLGWVLLALAAILLFRVARPGAARKALLFLAGLASAAFVVLTPDGFGDPAYREAADPVPNFWELRRDLWGPPPVFARGQTAVSGEAAVRVLDSRPGPPGGAEAWLSGFHVLTLRIEASRLGDTALELSADEHGEPERVKDCAGAPGSFDGTTGLVCFVVPPGYRPGYLLVGELDREVLLKLQ
ncbi:hypothetical protein P3102_17230 [Amycolatopsis sp. QT-25]|uniref:hypothetical protein n=1 Tax=Amycolatopsis sp. QT-25 TaxID=3034022 RepID=UPI0023EBC45E|nr:hypothetical protein [Amycolatopsis sp. QT-25]WET82820.1 hypothetical protein P3102_17230 [Amycolatopsis sp. QT-25]